MYLNIRLLLSCNLLFFWLQLQNTIFLFVIGLAGALGFFCLHQAYRIASPPSIAPFEYILILWSISLGWLVFGDVPDARSFIGIIIITEPGFESLNIYYIYPIIFCLGLSYVAIAIRQLSTTEPVWLISLNFSAAITFVSFFTIPFGWIMPDFKDLALLCMIGFLGGAANLWLSQSFKLSEVSLVSPLKYLALVFGIIFGYLIWDEIPTIKTVIGASLVIVSSIIIFRREIYYKKQDSLPRHE